MKSFLDRAFLVTSVNNYINYSEMMMPTSKYWNVIHGTTPGEAIQDEEGKQIMSVLGKNMAWLLKVIDSGKNNVKENEREDKFFKSRFDSRT